MIRNHSMLFLSLVLLAGSANVFAKLGRSEGEIRIDTKGNQVELSDDTVCHYNASQQSVSCKKDKEHKGVRTSNVAGKNHTKAHKGRNFSNVVTNEQHSGTRRQKPDNADKYIGSFVKEESQGTPGAGTVTYIYTAQE